MPKLTRLSAMLLFVLPLCAQNPPKCEKGQQPFGERCVSQRMADYISCVEASGANHQEITEEVNEVANKQLSGEAKGSGSGAIIKGSGSVALSSNSEKELVKKIQQKWYSDAMKQCANVLEPPRKKSSSAQPTHGVTNPVGSIVNQDSTVYAPQTVINTPPSRVLDDAHADKFKEAVTGMGSVAVFLDGTDQDIGPLGKQICDSFRDAGNRGLNCVGVQGYDTQIPVDLPAKLTGIHCYRANDQIRNAFKDTELTCIYHDQPFMSDGMTLGFPVIVIGNAAK